MIDDQLKAALIALHRAIKSANPPALVEAMKTVDDFVATRGDQLDPRLHHFLTGRSYAKALAYVGITDGSTAPGSCAPRSPNGGKS